MEIVYLNRIKAESVQTLGELVYKGQVVSKTIELPWINNENRISCIPIGRYKVERRFSTKYGNHFHVLNVPKRSYILIHSGNYYNQFLGCIGVGESFKDINKDGYLDVTASKIKLTELIRILPIEFDLIIT